MGAINEIRSWYNEDNTQYVPADIFLLHIKKYNLDKNIYPKIQKAYDDNQCIIKEVSSIKNSDIVDAINLNKRAIVYFDKQISLECLSIIKESGYRYIYFDLNLPQPAFSCIIQSMIPTDIAQNNIQYIKNFIQYFLSSSKNQKSKIFPSQIKKHLLRDKKNISLDTIKNDIRFLEQYNKLTSRLAIFIYKICTFEFYASEKEIGVYFSESFGKSKPLNKKTYGIQNVKGYNMNKYSDDPIYNTKLEIAKNLAAMQNEPINQQTILRSTGIDITMHG